MRKTLNEDDVLKEIDRWIGYLDEDMITRIKIGIKKLPSAQPEQSESEYITFWEKRAREYEEMVLKLTDEMARGIKIDSVLITEEGVVFKKEKPEQRWIPCKTALPEKGQYVLCQCRAGIMDVLRLTDDNDWYKDSTHIYMHGFVLAWCKLPEPYGGEAE